jgi:hypothetical protein
MTNPLNWLAALAIALLLGLSYHLDGPSDMAAEQAQADWLAEAQRIAADELREAKALRIVAQR